LAAGKATAGLRERRKATRGVGWLVRSSAAANRRMPWGLGGGFDGPADTPTSLAYDDYDEALSDEGVTAGP